MSNNFKWPVRTWHALSTPTVPPREDGALRWTDELGNPGSFFWQVTDQTIYTAVNSLGAPRCVIVLCRIVANSCEQRAQPVECPEQKHTLHADPCSSPNAPHPFYNNRPFSHESLCTLHGGTWNSTWDEAWAVPTRDPTRYTW